MGLSAFPSSRFSISVLGSTGALLILLLLFVNPVQSQNRALVDSLLKVAQTAEDPETEAGAYQSLSKTYRNINLDSAEIYIRKALKAASKAPEKELYYRTSTSLGVFYWMSGDLNNAGKVYREALNYWKSVGDSVEIARISLNLGSVYQAGGKEEEAIPLLRSAISISSAKRETLIEAQSNGALSLIFYQLKEIDSLQFYQQRSTQLFTELGDSNNIARSLINTGHYMGELGSPQQARTHLEDGISLATRISNISLAGRGHQLLANLEFRIGNNDQAISHYLEAKKIYESLGWQMRIAENQIALGSCFELLGRVNTAAKYYEDAFRVADSIQSFHIMAAAKHNLAEMAQKRGKCKQAISLFREAMAIKRKGLEVDSPIPDWLGLADCFEKLGEPDSTDRYLQIALKTAHKGKKDYLMGIVYQALGQTHFNRGEYNTSIVFLDSAETCYSLHHHPSGILKVNELRSECYAAQGNFLEAWKAQKLATQWRDSIISANSAEQLLDLEAKYWSERKEHSLAIAQKNEALQVAETARVQAASEKFAAQRNLLITLLLLVLLIGGLSYYMLRQRKKNELELKVSEMRMQTLHARMNPHFIFNALGSVQLLINTSNVREANLYLSKFARLLRMILEHSDRQSLRLEEEIAGLRLYLELEVLRFKFDYEVQVDPKLDPETLFVPGMLVQPFIENSIKHGISGLGKAGKLLVRFEAAGASDLRCIVEDNGVGREVAGRKGNGHPGQKSVGIGIVRERLRLLRGANPERLHIIDLKDETGKATGTRIEVLIPILIEKES